MIVGSLVKFKDGLYEEEQGMIYLVLVDNGDRGFIRWIGDANPIPASSLARFDEMEIVGYLLNDEDERGFHPQRKTSPTKRAGKGMA
ncbi:MAG: hypothetical protein AAGU04_06955 [Anaerolineaceae bacterium]